MDINELPEGTKVMVVVNTRCYVGEARYENARLKLRDVVEFHAVPVMQQAQGAFDILLLGIKCGTLYVPEGVVVLFLDAGSPYYRDYVKITTGLVSPGKIRRDN